MPPSVFRRLLVSLFLVFGLMLSGCDQSNSAIKNSDAKPENTPRKDVKKGITPAADQQLAVIETADYGQIVIELYPNVAPQMVERFKRLTQEGFYNGTTFHRINAGAGLIQGGDPLSKDDNLDNDGSGDSSYPNVRGEFSDLPFERGSVGAARRGPSPEFAGRLAVSEAQARDTANCQFFITLQRAPQFDEDYTVFGKVIQGIGNAEIIMRAPGVEEAERPADKIVVKTITLQPRAKYLH